MNRELGQSLRDAIVRPMIKDGAEGVTQSVEVMKEYSLLREDLDNLLEVCQWPNHENPLKNVEPKVKAAFTRLYNKEVSFFYTSNF